MHYIHTQALGAIMPDSIVALITGAASGSSTCTATRDADIDPFAHRFWTCHRLSSGKTWFKVVIADGQINLGQKTAESIVAEVPNSQAAFVKLVCPFSCCRCRILIQKIAGRFVQEKLGRSRLLDSSTLWTPHRVDRQRQVLRRLAADSRTDTRFLSVSQLGSEATCIQLRTSRSMSGT